jgi:TATA-binding protein-associated factor Taf7
MTIRKSGRASRLESDTESEESDEDDGDDDDEAEDEDDEDEEDEDQEDDEESDSQLNLKNIFKYLLPSFLFKWNGEIELEPDMADVKNYC